MATQIGFCRWKIAVKVGIGMEEVPYILSVTVIFSYDPTSIKIRFWILG